ncbi:wall-associated receptor kinase-like 10 [Prunus avium]|uniref:Wall-associated receptor kinase-like 10 n=1 Tax=Prunus avium TaxID=42229 RepID=A0A6P5TQS2_PRUAV|nr:wall-associated receptor kinase-like 10 [Prunus avium]
MLDCKPIDTPSEQNHKLGIYPDQVPTDKERYQRLVGKLIYLAHTRPDIAYAVNIVSQFMHSPSVDHMGAVTRILRYLKVTPGKGLIFSKYGHTNVEGYTDDDWAEKSDVYSFGVVLAELLTGQKAVSLMSSQESRSLATYFLLSMENNLLFNILDSQVMKDGRKEKITAVANLAVRCLNLNRRNRPTMKEVAVELEGIQLSVRADSDVQQVFPGVRCVQTQEINEVWDVVSTSTGPCTDGGTGSSFDVQPLLFFNTQ